MSESDLSEEQMTIEDGAGPTIKQDKAAVSSSRYYAGMWDVWQLSWGAM